jgi:predicted porin
MREYRQHGGQQAATAALPDVRARLLWFGANYAATPRVTLTGAVYRQDVLDAPAQADPVMFVGRMKYALSPRTDLYATAAWARARHGRPVSLARDEPGFGSSQRSIVAGIQHRF